jgi:hypothetical protein
MCMCTKITDPRSIGVGLGGYSNFPWDYTSGNKEDGVVYLYSTGPDGSREHYNLGATVVHEVGHWAGLYHTFENGCNAPGDYVDDTPYSASASSKCPTSRNSCPQQPGNDPFSMYPWALFAICV